MKKFILHFSLFGVSLAWSVCARDFETNAWGAVTNNLQMAINLSGKAAGLKTNEPVNLLIRYRNTSTKGTIEIPRANWVEGDPGYSFVVISPSGKDISPNPPDAPGSNGSGISIAAGAIGEVRFNLSYLCSLNEFGTYTIIAKKGMPSPDRKSVFQVVSNPLRVTVVPGVWEPTDGRTNNAAKSP